ncbi:MAG TPA: efflux RND transporter permease subunit [Polyangiaceae bacterium]
MHWLSNVSVRRPIFATVLVALVVVFGLFGATRLGVDRFPDVDFPVVSVITRLPGAAPKEVETDISMKIEEAVNTISGIDELRSISNEGVSQVYVTFELEKDIDAALQEVRDQVATVRADLPDRVEEPVVRKIDPAATPIVYVAVRSNAPIDRVTEIADKLVRRRIESTAGVGQVSVLGGSKRQINVRLDPARLRALDVTALDVEKAIASSNQTVPGGRLEAGPEQEVLRIRGRVSKPDALGEIVIAERKGAPVHVRDVASVEDGVESPETAALRDGTPAVLLSIRKQSGANSVAVVDQVRERIAEMTPELPSGYSLEVIRDNTAIIRTSVAAVVEHLVLGALFAGAVVLVFLGSVRSTVIAAVAIPVSIIGTFALMWVQGFTMNTITMLALALAVGIVIDDAIVVLENIHRTIEEKGLSPVKASILATKEIALAVLATTLSLVAVFLPVALMSGVVGRFLKSFGMTMAFSILVSMLVSFTLTPMLSSRWLSAKRPHAAGAGQRKPLLERLTDRVHTPIERAYTKLLTWVMKRRWVVVAVSLATLATALPLLEAVPKGFLPKSDDAEFEINLRTPEGTSLEATVVAAERLARDVRAVPSVRSTMLTIGDNNERAPNLARVYVKLAPPEEREASQFDVMETVRKTVVARQPKSFVIDVSQVPMFTGGGKEANVIYEISGPDLDDLERYAAELTARVRKIPGAVDVNTSLVSGKPETNLDIHRERAADLGVKVSDISNTLRLFVGGAEVSRYEEDGESYPINVRGELESRVDFGSLALLGVPAAGGTTVPLSELVRAEKDTGPGSIERSNRRRQIVLYANVAPNVAQGTVMEAIESAVREMKLPSAYRVAPSGQSREMKRTGVAFLTAFALSFVFMYLVLAAQFESWLHPITILLALPLTLPFALVSLVLFRQSLDIYSMLGLLVLFGVIKKNAILQIDYTNQLRARGMERTQAIIEANRERLRPILMTTLAFVAGMVPLMFSTGVGAGFNHATSGVIVGGQVLSLLLTLLATPVAYSLFDDLSAWISRRFGKQGDAALRERELAELEGVDSPNAITVSSGAQ